MGDRSAEDGHDRVADVLLDHASEPLDLLANAGVVGLQGRVHVLRVGRVGAGREPDEVDEDDETTFRSACCGEASASGAAQARQNRARSGFSSPQRAQIVIERSLDRGQRAA